MSNNSYKVLIIDDEPSNIESLFDILNKEGFQVLVASNSKEGIVVANDILPSLIIMDWDMPGLDGIEATKILKDNEKTAAIPIIIATGKMLTSEHLSLALEAGAGDFVRKPLDHVEVIARVKSMLRYYEMYNSNLDLQSTIYQQQLMSLEQKLATKNQELTSSTMHLIHHNQQMKELFEELEEMATACEQEKKVQLRAIIRRHKINVNQGAWEEFDKAFLSVNLEFYDRLNQTHQDLTINEKRLCAFSKMNLTNREIAQLTARSEEAVKKAKQRLRIKLGLDSNMHISDYIQQF